MEPLWNLPKPTEHVLNTEFSDFITNGACSRIVIELIKYIIYQKQQLPYHFDRLKFIVTKRKMNSEKENSKNKLLIERQFNKAAEGLEVLELLFKSLKEEIRDVERGIIQEVALVFGSTVYTPRQIYRLELPNLCLGHLDCNHSENRSLLETLNSIVMSSTLNAVLNQSMNPTNMFILIRKSFSSKCLNSWFQLKERYMYPTTAHQFTIRLMNPSNDKLTCLCNKQNMLVQDEIKDILNVSDYGEEFVQHHDLNNSLGEKKCSSNIFSISDIQRINIDISGIELFESDEEKDSVCTHNTHKDTSFRCDSESNVAEGSNKPVDIFDRTEWFQAPVIFKGFKDTYINGVSVSDFWM